MKTHIDDWQRNLRGEEAKSLAQTAILKSELDLGLQASKGNGAKSFLPSFDNVKDFFKVS